MTKGLKDNKAAPSPRVAGDMHEGVQVPLVEP